MSYERGMTEYLRIYDRKLYCKKVGDHHFIYRESHRWEHYDLDESTSLSALRPTPNFIFALTSDWKKTGKPVEWSKMKVWDRLRMIDSHNRDVLEDLMASYEKDEKQKERQNKNQIEDSVREMAPQFKKAFSDTITANMNKQVSVERRQDRMIKH